MEQMYHLADLHPFANLGVLRDQTLVWGSKILLVGVEPRTLHWWGDFK